MTDRLAAPNPHESATIVARFDAAVDRAFDRLRGRPLPDRIFYTASELGDFSLLWHLLAVSRGLRRGDLATAARVSAALGIESALVNGPIKSLFRRSRPVADTARPHRLRQPRTSSFPSGHASAATVFVAMADDDAWRLLYVLLAGTVATSRVYVRIHHASDVVGGVVVGAAIGRALRSWWPAGRSVPRGITPKPRGG